METAQNKGSSLQLRLPKRNPLTGVWHEFERVRLTDLKEVRRLGQGGFGTVDLVTIFGKPSRAYALKKVQKKKGYQMYLRMERTILSDCGSSDFIVKLYKTFQSMSHEYMLMEWCQGGDLEAMINKCGGLGEKASRFYIACTVEALEFLQQKKIIHRDLKPCNLMLDGLGYVKLIDFGFAKNLNGGRTNTMCGTSVYMAPEVILGKLYDQSADLWSLGVTAFELISGRLPFTDTRKVHSSEESLLNARRLIRFPTSTVWSLSAVCLMTDLLNVEASQRIGHLRGMNELKSHQWFNGFDWKSLQARTMAPPAVPKLEERRNEDVANLWPDF